MKIEKAVLSSHDRDGGNYIITLTDENIHLDDLLSVKIDDDIYYYKVEQIEAINDFNISIKAKEAGYYNKISKSEVNIRRLIGKKLSLVEDKEIISKIEQESRYI